MDIAFELVYEIDKVYFGEAERQIKFIGFYHYAGLPRYTTHGIALLHLKPNSQGQFLLANLKPLHLLGEEEDSPLIYCDEWGEDEECEISVRASDLAKKWKES